MGWRLAKSLEQLRAQVNLAFPNRSKASDGAIGDESHQAGKSDHNPNSAGVVTAIDITHDIDGGFDARKLAVALVLNRDSRIKYLIWNRRMVSSYPAHGYPAWAWRPYNGKNPHDKHLHVSVNGDASAYDSQREWDLDVEVLADPVDPNSPPPYPGKVVTADMAIRRFQQYKGLTPDGIVGAKTWAELFK